MVEQRSTSESALACGLSKSTSSRWQRRFLECSTSERMRILGALLSAYASVPAQAGLAEADLLADLAWCRELLPIILSWIV